MCISSRYVLWRLRLGFSSESRKFPSRLHSNDSLLHSESLQTRYLRRVIERGHNSWEEKKGRRVKEEIFRSNAKPSANFQARVISSGYVVKRLVIRIAHAYVRAANSAYTQRFLLMCRIGCATWEGLDMKGSNRKSGSQGVFRSLLRPASGTPGEGNLPFVHRR